MREIMKKLALRGIAVFLLILVGLSGCSLFSTNDDDEFTDPEPNPGDIKVLILGSLYLDTYDCEDMIKKLGTTESQGVFVESRYTTQNSLASHSQNGESMALIAKRDWDYVILQGNSHYIAKEEWHPTVVPAIEALRDTILAQSPQCKVIYMMPWAYKNGYDAIGGQTGNYAALQQDIIDQTIEVIDDLNIVTAPVGYAWNQIRTNAPGLELYSDDGARANLAGTFIAACTIYVTITEHNISNLTYTGNINSADAAIIRNTASTSVLNHRSDWGLSNGI
jgi:hypothetical protein